MGFLDDVLGSLFMPFTRSDRGLERLVRDGEHLPAILDGVRIKVRSDSADEQYLGLTVRGPFGDFRAGVCQGLHPDYGDRARLGAEVVILHLDGKVAVDWPETMRRDGITLAGDPAVVAGKTLKEPPAPGIEDGNLDGKKLRSWAPATAEVVAVEDKELFGMPRAEKRVVVRLGDGREVERGNDHVPVYARHLARPGTTVPVVENPKKPGDVRIDWARAAEQEAGIVGPASTGDR
jgi:hypothetical protein